MTKRKDRDDKGTDPPDEPDMGAELDFDILGNRGRIGSAQSLRVVCATLVISLALVALIVWIGTL